MVDDGMTTANDVTDDVNGLNGNGQKLKLRTWRSRRRLAIAAFAWIVLETLLLFLLESPQ